MKRRLFLLHAAAALICGCGSKPAAVLTPADFRSLGWDEMLKRARGTEVAFAMWAEDESRNRFFRNDMAKILLDRYGIRLRIVPLSDTVEGVNKLLNEKSAGKATGGGVDVIWINGENFRAAKQGGVLWGPFIEELPNFRLYDKAVSERDFGTPIEGMQAPWERAQFVLAYDTARFPVPPDSIDQLLAWVKSHPGRFTYIAPPDFTGSAFLRHLLFHFGGYDPHFWTGFDEGLYRRASDKTFSTLNELKPYLWRKGETYPPTLSSLIQLFANREVDFAMSYGPSFASVLIERGEFPPTIRTFVFRRGTLGNYSFLAIPFNANNPAGALIAINDMMSFETIMAMSSSMDHVFPHRLEALTAEQRARVNEMRRGVATLPVAELESHYLPEADAEYLNRLDKDWNAKVLRQ